MNEHDVVIATSLSSEVENGFDSKRRWLFNHIPEFDLKHFICTNRKELLKGDLLIDDASHYLRAWRHDGGNIKGIVMDAPWNKDVDFFPRAGNWNDVLGIVRFHVVADEYHKAKNEFHDLQNKFETNKIINSVDRTLKHVDKLMKGTS
jgi:5'(3')-deoxyribonucleotidase